MLTPTQRQYITSLNLSAAAASDAELIDILVAEHAATEPALANLQRQVLSLSGATVPGGEPPPDLERINKLRAENHLPPLTKLRTPSAVP